MLIRKLLLFFLLLTGITAYGQQDVDFHLGAQLLKGINVLKVKRDFYDPYLWVLAQNNHVYRINSLTLVVDDYTQTFAPYNNVNFVDIAGRSADTVYVATNATEVIEYEKGAFRPIDKTSGIAGTINSIGLDNRSANGGYNSFLLSIGTTTNFYSYNFQTEKITTQSNNKGQNQVFEATYRTLAVSDVGDNYYDLTKQFPVYNLTYQTAYGGDVQYNTPEFGYTVNTYYYITDGFSPWMGDYDDVDLLMQVWGTEKGLFQNQWDYSYFPWDATVGYLPGIKVNKVTSIFGLLAFSSPGNQFPNKMERENLLVGTQNGLYFTNSYFNKYASGVHDLNTFTLDADIGNQNINDICVDATTYTKTLCEDGVWVAAENGLYFIKPDYGAYLDTQQLQAVSFQNQAATLSDLKLCAGETTTALVNTSVYSGNSILWYKDGNELKGATSNALSINSAGSYYAVLYDPCSGLHIQSNVLTVEIITAPVFTFNYPDKIQQCDNTPLTLQTTDNPGYTYRWYTNGVLNGNTTSSYAVTQTGKYKVEVSACTNSWVPSKEVEVDLVTLPVPQVSSDKAVYCAEDVAVLTENAPADPSYTINWYRDGTLLTADNNLTTINETTPGSYTVALASTISTCTQPSAALPLAFTPAPVFTFNYPNQLQYCAGTPLTLQVTGSTSYQYRWYKDGTLNGVTTASLPVTQNGAYKVEVSSCAGSWVASREVKVTFIKVPVPAISTDKPVYCFGDNATLSLAETIDPDYTTQWYKDNVPVPNSTSQNSIITNVPGNYTVTLSYSTPNTDGSICSQSSAVQTLTFNPLPTVSIEKIVNTTICEGQTIGLKANYNGGTVQWSTGETTDQISVTQAGNYQVTVTSPSGCQAETSMNISFLTNPVFSVNDTTICTYKKQVITLTAPAGFARYAWNGQTGNQTYQVSLPQTVSLTVTDANGCQATQQIKVVDQCPNIYIPNTFTPNGDGINDTWVIEGLDNDPSPSVKVFTRNGVLIFNSIGYGTPWNGEYKGNKLPAGAYYYIVTAKNNTQKFSGSLTIIY
ncbi:MAG TPA: gliding motility-associated C-terminal domain-containing protein [Mucilaginibacter sp.]|nr:gliding motility-associated C-terminal domain-containing protein [Mucilaginibacter sp.]